MLSIEIVCIGKLNQSFYREGCAEYLKRLGAYAKVTVTELPEVKPRGVGPAADRQVVEREGESILSHIAKRRACVTALCIEGEQPDSAAFARRIGQGAMQTSDSMYIIGGSFGLSGVVKERADYRLSLSRMTMAHQLARLVLLEQLYRACSIAAGAKYHK